MQEKRGAGTGRFPNPGAEIFDSLLVGSFLLAWTLILFLAALPSFLVAALVLPSIPEVLYSFD